MENQEVETGNGKWKWKMENGKWKMKMEMEMENEDESKKCQKLGYNSQMYTHMETNGTLVYGYSQKSLLYHKYEMLFCKY